jgi:ferredoxin, 2Fe-2S
MGSVSGKTCRLVCREEGVLGTIRVLTGRGEELTIDADSGKSLLLAAISQGQDHPFMCMNAECHTCKDLILEGAEHLLEPRDEERESLGEELLGQGYRLACQALCKDE